MDQKAVLFPLLGKVLESPILPHSPLSPSKRLDVYEMWQEYNQRLRLATHPIKETNMPFICMICGNPYVGYKCIYCVKEKDMREIHVPPKPAKTRYSCDFCKKTVARKETMERHEIVCYYNPNRVCPICDGSGRLREWHEDGFLLADDECHPCKVAEEISAIKKPANN